MTRRLAVVAALALAACGPKTTTLHAVAPQDIPRREPAYSAPDPSRGKHNAIAEAQRAWDRQRHQRASRSRNLETRPANPSGDVWHRLAMCESGMRQDAVGEGVHFSYFQWKLATWRSVKADGDPADPRHASYAAQVAAAQRLQARSGWGQWPACSRKIGVR